jgi:hypothetical protein
MKGILFFRFISLLLITFLDTITTHQYNGNDNTCNPSYDHHRQGLETRLDASRVTGMFSFFFLAPNLFFKKTKCTMMKPPPTRDERGLETYMCLKAPGILFLSFFLSFDLLIANYRRFHGGCHYHHHHHHPVSNRHQNGSSSSSNRGGSTRAPPGMFFS